MNTIKSGPGFNILKKMGWEEGKSLGRKGGGILKPVEVEVTGIRMKGNTRGLGFEHKKERGDKDTVGPWRDSITVVKIFASGEHYGAGACLRNSVCPSRNYTTHQESSTRPHTWVDPGICRVAIVGAEESSKCPGELSDQYKDKEDVDRYID